jgi:RNA polymerase sigma factor (sigma-70 family)
MINTAESAIDAWLNQRDQNAAAWLINEHRHLVLSTARRWGVPAEMEQDAVQEVFIRVFNKLHRFRPEKPFLHWLSIVTRYTCAKLRRHWCHRHHLSTVFENSALDLTHAELTHNRSPDHEASVREDIRRLQIALGQLLPHERLLIEQQLAHDSTQARPSSPASRVALYRVRAKLRHPFTSP